MAEHAIAEPLVYLSNAQTDIVERLFPSLANVTLPAWVPQRLIADDLGLGHEGLTRGLASTGGVPWLWATEFENVHNLWRYNEPALVIGGIEYTSAETYYHAQKPDPFDAALWESIKDQVMRVALRAKLDADPALGALLRATKGHPLLSLKPDTYWGVDAHSGGQNRLAKLWMELRDEIESREFGGR